MSFLSLVVHNLLRRPGRSALTLLGVAIGMAAVITLVSLARGFERTWSAAYDAAGADLLIGKTTSAKPLPSPFADSLILEFRRMPHVAEATGVLTELLSIEDAPAVLVFGWEPGSFVWRHLSLLEGRWPIGSDERAVALGSMAADMLGKRVGDHIQIEALDCLVVGRFSSPSFAENGAIVMNLRQLQEAAAREGLVNFASLRLEPAAGPDAAEGVRAEVRRRFAGFTAETTGEVIRRNVAVQAARAMSLATSLIALLIGAVGMTNTILMSVLERRREMAVLQAVGWRRSRVMGLIVAESVVLSVAGGMVGALAGAGLLRAMQWSPWFQGKIETTADSGLLVAAVGLAVGLGALCGAYPAWKATRASLTEGLHHE